LRYLVDPDTGAEQTGWPETQAGWTGEGDLKLLTPTVTRRRDRYGLEWRLLRRLPHAAIGVTAAPLLFLLLVRWLPPDVAADAGEKHVRLAEIFTIAVILTGWTAIFTLAIGCFVVYVMKGPAYVADRYDLVDSDHPRDTPGDDD